LAFKDINNNIILATNRMGESTQNNYNLCIFKTGKSFVVYGNFSAESVLMTSS